MLPRRECEIAFDKYWVHMLLDLELADFEQSLKQFTDFVGEADLIAALSRIKNKLAATPKSLRVIFGGKYILFHFLIKIIGRDILSFDIDSVDDVRVASLIQGFMFVKKAFK